VTGWISSDRYCDADPLRHWEVRTHSLYWICSGTHIQCRYFSSSVTWLYCQVLAVRRARLPVKCGAVMVPLFPFLVCSVLHEKPRFWFDFSFELLTCHIWDQSQKSRLQIGSVDDITFGLIHLYSYLNHCDNEQFNFYGYFAQKISTLAKKLWSEMNQRATPSTGQVWSSPCLERISK